MRPRTAKVSEDSVVGAAGFLQGVGQDGEPGGVQFTGGEDALVVCIPGKRDNVRCVP